MYVLGVARTFSVNLNLYSKKLEAIAALLGELDIADGFLPTENEMTGQNWVFAIGGSPSAFPVAWAMAGAPGRDGKYHIAEIQEKIAEIIYDERDKRMSEKLYKLPTKKQCFRCSQG